mmetsp:Transcript_39982/g.62389  ORF Transcript_39982/g.62389 Transcript_39982/m.62389 type:complete len:217 (+) Transcript_39982:124-774(+)
MRGAKRSEQSLLQGSDRLTADNLKVLASDVEETLGDVEAQLNDKVDVNTNQRCQRGLQMATEALEELKLQGRSSSRADQAAVEMLYKKYKHRLDELERNRQALEALAISSGTYEGTGEERRKAASRALERASEIQEDSKASVKRSLGLVTETEQIGKETAVVLKGQTEQMKSIYADVSVQQSHIPFAATIKACKSPSPIAYPHSPSISKAEVSFKR